MGNKDSHLFDKKGNTYLILEGINKNTEFLTKYLNSAENRVHLGHKNKEGNTALTIAMQYNEENALAILKYPTECNINCKIILKSLELNIYVENMSVSYYNFKGAINPLYYAIYKKKEKVALRFAQELGKNFTKISKNMVNVCLYLALYNNMKDVVYEILNKKGMYNFKNMRGYYNYLIIYGVTLIYDRHIATLPDDLTYVLNYLAKIDALNEDFLHFAIKNNHSGLIMGILDMPKKFRLNEENTYKKTMKLMMNYSPANVPYLAKLKTLQKK